MKSFSDFFSLASSGLLCMENADMFHFWGFNSVPVVVQLLSLVQLFAALWDYNTPIFQAFTNSQSLLKLRSFKSGMPSKYLILCHPLLLPSIFPRIRDFSNESVLQVRWLKYWNFNFIISPWNEYSGLISFRIDWFNFLVV